MPETVLSNRPADIATAALKVPPPSAPARVSVRRRRRKLARESPMSFDARAAGVCSHRVLGEALESVENRHIARVQAQNNFSVTHFA